MCHPIDRPGREDRLKKSAQARQTDIPTGRCALSCDAEMWLRGRKRFPAKEVTAQQPFVGSNPTISAHVQSSTPSAGANSASTASTISRTSDVTAARGFCAIRAAHCCRAASFSVRKTRLPWFNAASA